MEDKELRRKTKRHALHWKAAVVFDKADGRPILHTETRDLSAGGAAIQSDYSDLTGSMVTLLLAQPLRQSGEAPKMLKIRARVVSSMQSPSISGFRHGLSFEQSKDGDLETLAQILGTADSAQSRGPATPAAPPGATPEAPAVPAAGGRLAILKALALAKQSEEKKPNAQDEINARVSGALERAYRFLNEFTEHLNIVKPDYPTVYAIVGVPKFDDLKWESGRIDLRARETSPTTKIYEQVALNFKLSANKELRVARDTPADEKLKQMLAESKIRFTAQPERNERGSLVRSTFVIPCEVEASLALVGNFSTGKLLLKIRNIQHFGMLEHVLAPEAITDEALEELTGFILGESGHLGPLLLLNA